MITITNVLAFDIDSENADGFFLYCEDKWLYYWNNTTKVNEKITYINNIFKICQEIYSLYSNKKQM
jgi:hypothetical protein